MTSIPMIAPNCPAISGHSVTWTAATPSVDRSKPASRGRLKTGHHQRAAETVDFYLTSLAARKQARRFLPF